MSNQIDAMRKSWKRVVVVEVAAAANFPAEELLLSFHALLCDKDFAAGTAKYIACKTFLSQAALSHFLLTSPCPRLFGEDSFFFKSSQTRRKKARDFLELSNDSVFMKTDVVRLFLVVFKHCDILELS